MEMKTTINLGGPLSAVCQVTGRKPGYGKQVSHAKGTKTVDKRGIEAVVAELKAKEVKL